MSGAPAGPDHLVRIMYIMVNTGCRGPEGAQPQADSGSLLRPRPGRFSGRLGLELRNEIVGIPAVDRSRELDGPAVRQESPTLQF